MGSNAIELDFRQPRGGAGGDVRRRHYERHRLPLPWGRGRHQQRLRPLLYVSFHALCAPTHALYQHRACIKTDGSGQGRGLALLQTPLDPQSGMCTAALSLRRSSSRSRLGAKRHIRVCRLRHPAAVELAVPPC